MPRIVITDDHPLFRSALSQAVSKVWPDADIVEAETIAQARSALEDAASDLLLLDVHLPDSNGLTALLDFRQDFPAMPIAIVSASEEAGVSNAAQSLGACAFIPKSAPLEDMRRALAAVEQGDFWFPIATETSDADNDDFTKLASLTPAQRRILMLINEGLLNKQIAFQMDISEATVKAHITAIFRKLGVINRTQAVLIAQKLDVPLPVTNMP
ncbi:response regulator transcription factor [Alterisphingorhabdus coralli]|uniref:Response regulator transcription factor n=1 Tax=Alterisphingorhabdus coralli TaxID=3071408 RepID=A0AA97HZP3_9SPHN|nr:response regulator transcription factor [Parasphingorhabdus sp. SCSIO 66989]WOE74944.1 response regulator transcription factor [Parasphingorhabdus sp. SCSIO 66989]